MGTVFEDLDRYLLITADTHAGSDPRGYEPYLEKKWHDDFEAWVEAGERMAKIMRQVMAPPWEKPVKWTRLSSIFQAAIACRMKSTTLGSSLSDQLDSGGLSLALG